MPSPRCPRCHWGCSFPDFDGHPAPEGPPAPLMAPRFHPRFSFPLIWHSAPRHGERPAMPGCPGRRGGAWCCVSPPCRDLWDGQAARAAGENPASCSRAAICWIFCFHAHPSSFCCSSCVPLIHQSPGACQPPSHRHHKPSSSPIPVLPSSIPCSSVGPS